MFPTLGKKDIHHLDLSVSSSFVGHQDEFNDLDLFQFKIDQLQKEYPTQILAVTFTNKAAKEMQDRISKILKKTAIGLPWLGTFHSVCAKLLRKHARAVDLNSNFTIVDQDDQIKLIKNISKAENVDTKKISPKYILSIIDQFLERLFAHFLSQIMLQ